MKILAKGSHNRCLGFSVEGKVLESSGNRITKVFLKDVAITANAVNTKTYVELVKSLKDKADAEKKASVVTEPDLIKKSEDAESTSEKVLNTAATVAEIAKSEETSNESNSEVDKGLAAGYATNQGNGTQVGGGALRTQSLDKDVKILTNPPDIIEYTMKKSLIFDPEVAKKIIEYTAILVERGII